MLKSQPGDRRLYGYNYLPDHEIGKIADEKRLFYGFHDFPINPELFAQRVGLTVKPIADIKKMCRVDGFLMGDQYIAVDMKTYFDYPFRTNFTIAHEIGHYFLHPKVTFKDDEDFLEFYENLDNRTFRSYEYQANEFAGRFLVPFAKLKERIGFMQKQGQAVTNIELGRDFCVSHQVISRRRKKENL